MGKIIYAKTDDSKEIKTLIEILKDTLHAVNLDFIQDIKEEDKKPKKKKSYDDDDNDNDDESDVSDDEHRRNKKAKQKSKKKKSYDSDESDMSDDEHSRNKKSKQKSKKKKSRNKNNSDDNTNDESDVSDDEHSRNKKTKHKSKKKKSRNESDMSDDDNDDNSGNDNNDKDDENNNNSNNNSKMKSKAGIKIVALDDKQTLLIFIKLQAVNFLEFEVNRPSFRIGLELSEFYKFIKCADKESTLSLYVDEHDEQNIKFNLEHGTNTGADNTNYTQKLMDIDDDDCRLPEELSFDLVAIIKTATFRKICSYLNQFSNYVEIRCTPTEIIFKVVGDSNATDRTIKNDRGARITNQRTDKKANIFQAIYSLKNLTSFSKCCNLCDEMQICMTNDKPLFMMFDVGTLGRLVVGVSPIDEKQLKQDNNMVDDDTYTDMDVYYPDDNVIIKQ